MNQNVEKKLEKLVSNFNKLPYLFIGPGLSMRYSDVPLESSLLKNIWLRINNYDEDSYEKYIKEVENNVKNLNNNQNQYYLNQKLATRIQQNFNDNFYNNNNFKEVVFTKDQLHEILDNGYDPFKFYMAEQIKNFHILSYKNECKEISYIKRNNNKIAGIITTNYDNILEQLFKDFNVISGQDDILISNVNNIFNIFKIYGSVEYPNSIVITENDYDNFKSQFKYLSAKFLNIFIEHPIIFIGYEFEDLNIQCILKEIFKFLDINKIEKVKNNFIFIKIDSKEKSKIENKKFKFEDKEITLKQIIINDFYLFLQSLSNIKRPGSVKLIKEMQNMINNFITTTDNDNNVIIGNIIKTDITKEKLGMFFGKLDIVSNVGFNYYSITDIIEDIILDNKPRLINKKLITRTFKNIRSSAGKTYLPVYKYINKLNINVEDLPEDWKFIKSMDDIILTSNEIIYTKERKTYKCIKDIERDYGEHIPKQLSYIIYSVTKGNIEVEDLRAYLKERIIDDEFMKYYSTQIKKLAAMYDYMKYSSRI